MLRREASSLAGKVADPLYLTVSSKTAPAPSYWFGLSDLEIRSPSTQVGGMKHVDMRKLPPAAQEERRRQVIGLR